MNQPRPQVAPAVQPVVAPDTSIQHDQDRSAADLPPSARSEKKREPHSAAPSRRKQPPSRGRRLLLAGAAGLMALAAAASGLFAGGEQREANWRHHEQAAARNEPVKWISTAGPAVFGPAILIGAEDVDRDVTEQVAKSGRYGSLDTVNETVRRAQKDLPPAPADSQDAAPEPSITTGMRNEVLSGDTKFYHIHLFDSCYEDGDVVDVVIDGHPFARVPITRAGSTLSVPLSSGSTIEIVGVRDGVGGITVACSTSRGEGFMRALFPGERQLLSIVPGK